MPVSGLASCSSRFCLKVHEQGLGTHAQGSSFSIFGNFGEKVELLRLKRSSSMGSDQKHNKREFIVTKCARGASFDDKENDRAGEAIFPRSHIKDPYKRLGISREASEEEIQSARNFLLYKYARHKPSVDAIESAHNKIIMQKLYERKNPKIDIKKKFRTVSQSRFVQVVTSRFQTPSRKLIIKTCVAFILLGVLTFLFPTEEGPTVQVALSLLATVYFIYDRLKRKLKALLFGAGAFVISWLLGTFLMVSVIPPLLKGPRSLEVSTSLITYVLLWISSTYLK